MPWLCKEKIFKKVYWLWKQRAYNSATFNRKQFSGKHIKKVRNAMKVNSMNIVVAVGIAVTLQGCCWLGCGKCSKPCDNKTPDKCCNEQRCIIMVATNSVTAVNLLSNMGAGAGVSPSGAHVNATTGRWTNISKSSLLQALRLKRGACVLYGRMVMAETSESESCEYENKYYNICSELQNLVSIAKVSAPSCFCGEEGV